MCHWERGQGEQPTKQTGTGVVLRGPSAQHAGANVPPLTSASASSQRKEEQCEAALVCSTGHKKELGDGADGQVFYWSGSEEQSKLQNKCF